MQRRRFLKVSIAAGLALAGAGAGFYAWHRRAPSDAEIADVVRALIPAMLAGAGPVDAASLERGAALVLGAIAGLPPATRAELDQLFALLLLAPTRLALTGINHWIGADAVAVAAFLQRWRTHRLALLRTAYLALHDIVLGSWYSAPQTWAAIGYPGPLPVLANKDFRP